MFKVMQIFIKNKKWPKAKYFIRFEKRKRLTIA